MRQTVKALLLSGVIAAACSPVFAQSQGDWTFGIGYGSVMPKSGNGTLAGLPLDVGDDESFTFTVEYFIQNNLGIELLAATPFEHSFTLGPGITGSTKHLPPTLSLNYHFPTGGPWTPYVGAGINYTTFSSEQISIAGTLDLDDSWGFAVQAGLDYQVGPNSWFRVNLRWFDIDSDASLNGVPIGTAEIDPVFLGISYVHRF